MSHETIAMSYRDITMSHGDTTMSSVDITMSYGDIGHSMCFNRTLGEEWPSEWKAVFRSHTEADYGKKEGVNIPEC